MRLIGLVLVLVAVLAAGCTDGPGARRVLEGEGVMQIEVTGYSFFGCGQEDTFHTGFRGVKHGRPVEGVVCSGFLKGYTIRYF